MSLRQVIAPVTLAWDNSTISVPVGTILDIPPGSGLEAAYGLSNLTPLTGQPLASEQQGSGLPGLSN